MKKTFLGLALIFTATWIFGVVGQLLPNELPELQRQTWILLVNLKLAIALLCYIAWRVTPPSTSPTKAEGEKN